MRQHTKTLSGDKVQLITKRFGPNCSPDSYATSEPSLSACWRSSICTHYPPPLCRYLSLSLRADTYWYTYMFLSLSLRADTYWYTYMLVYTYYTLTHFSVCLLTLSSMHAYRPTSSLRTCTSLSMCTDTLLCAYLVTHFFSAHMRFLVHVYWHPFLRVCSHPSRCMPTDMLFSCVPLNVLLHARLPTCISMHSQNPSAVHMTMCSLMPVFWHTSLCT